MRLLKDLGVKVLFLSVFFFGAQFSFSKDLEIEGDKEVSRGQEVWYDVNFDYAGALEWEVEGGVIIDVEGDDEYGYTYGYSQGPYGKGIWDFESKFWLIVSDDQKYAQLMNYYGPVYGFTYVSTDLGNPFKGLELSFMNFVSLPGGFKFTIPEDEKDNINTGASANFCAGTCAGFVASAIKRTRTRIKVRWNANGPTGKISVKGKDLSLLGTSGNKSSSSTVYICDHPNNELPLISHTGLSKKCTEGLGVWTSQKAGQEYVWYSDGAKISGQWGSGANIDYFTKTGVVTVAMANIGRCGGLHPARSISINVEDVNPGPLVNNVTGNDVAIEGVKLDCEGNANLRLPYLHHQANYHWTYNSIRYNSEYTLEKGLGRTSFRGGDFADEQSEVEGKVTVSGVCGVHEIPFIVPALQSPILSENIITCSNTATVEAFLPANNKVYSWWVTSGNAFVVSQNSRSAKIEFTGSGTIKKAEVCASVECGGTLCTDVVFGNQYAEGLQSGQLADAQIPITSQVAYAPGQKIYFTSTDGDIHYYEFVNGLEKWVLNKTNWTTSANTDNTTISPLAYSYADNTVFYWSDGVELKANNSSVNYIIAGVLSEPLKLIVTNSPNNNINRGVLFVLEPNGKLSKVVRGGNQAIQVDIVNPITIAATVDYGVFYFKGNNLSLRDFDGIERVVLANVSPNLTTDLEVRAGFVYYTETSGHIRKVDISTGAFEIVNPIVHDNTASTGGFVIGETTNEVYYPNRHGTLYVSEFKNNSWGISVATNGYDDVKGSLVYQYPHVYYVSVEGRYPRGEYFSQGLWNTYYVAGCKDAVSTERKGVVTQENTKVELYPNPVSDVLYINTYEKSIKTIDLMDLRGVVVKSFENVVNTISIDGVLSGMYHVKIILNDDTMVVESVVVQ